MCRRDTEPERRRVKKRGKKAKRGEEWEGRGDEPHGQDNTFWRYKNECFSLAYLHGDSAPLESEREKRDERKRKKEREREREGAHGFLSILHSVWRLVRTMVCSQLNRSKRLPDIGEFAFWIWSKERGLFSSSYFRSPSCEVTIKTRSRSG